MSKHTKVRFTLLLTLFLILAACTTADSEEETTPAADTITTTEETETEESEEPLADAEQEDSAPEQSESANAVTITFAVYDWERGRYEDLIETFEEGNADVTVRLVSIEEILELDPTGGQWPEDADIRLATGADVFSNVDINGMAREGLLLDLSPFLAADTTFNSEDFYPGLLQQYQWDGGTWALPSEVNFNLIFFNKDAFDEAGVDYPEPGWTWDDFLAAAQALTIREGDEVSQWGFVETFFNPITMVQSRVDSLVDETTDPPTVHLDSAEVIDAVRWYTDLFLTHEVAPYSPPPDPEDDGPITPQGYQLIEEGKAAMWPEFSGSWEWRSQQMNLGVVPFPVDDDRSKTTPIYGSGYAVSAGTQKPDAAWRWINFLTQQTEVGFFGNPNALPARQAVAEASGFWDDVDEEFATTLRYAVEHAYAPTYGTFYGAFQQAVQAIMEDGKPVAEAMADAQVAAEEVIAEAEIEEADATPPAEIVVAEPEPEEEISEDAVVIEFVSGGGSFSLQFYRDLAEQFRETHPNIVVELETPNFTSGPVDMQEIAADADCFQWFPNLEDEEIRAAVLNLEPFLDADPELSADDFFSVALDPFTHQGQLFGLPGELRVTVMSYNKDLFDEAGVAYPELDWTTDDFLEKAVALTKGEDEESKQYGYVPDYFEVNDMFLMLDRLGAQIIDDSTNPPSFSLTAPSTVEAMRWYVSLTKEHGVKPVFQTDIMGGGGVSNFEDREKLVDSGRAAMWVDTGLNIPLINEEERDAWNLGVVPLPAGPTGRRGGSFSSSSGYFISAATEARQQCWQWITFLTAQASSNEFSQGVPARRSVAESEAYRQKVGAERAAAVLAALADATEPSFFQRFTSESAWLSFSFFWIARAYDQILTEDIPVEEALQNAQEIASDYRSCIIEREGLNDSDIQQECVQEADETIPSNFFGGSSDDDDDE